MILAGHDAVAYFTQNKSVFGNTDFTAVHKGVIYRFSTAAKRDTFSSNPEKYEPASSGFSAYVATFSKKFEIDGKAFEIVDGKLYVNRNSEVYDAWKLNIPKRLMEADTERPEIEFIAAYEL